MKRLAMFFVVTSFAGVCWGQMTPKYDTYTTYSFDSNLVIYQTVVVEGIHDDPNWVLQHNLLPGFPVPSILIMLVVPNPWLRWFNSYSQNQQCTG
jgi:hypothetical protein